MGIVNLSSLANVCFNLVGVKMVTITVYAVDKHVVKHVRDKVN